MTGRDPAGVDRVGDAGRRTSSTGDPVSHAFRKTKFPTARLVAAGWIVKRSTNPVFRRIKDEPEFPRFLLANYRNSPGELAYFTFDASRTKEIANERGFGLPIPARAGLYPETMG